MNRARRPDHLGPQNNRPAHNGELRQLCVAATDIAKRIASRAGFITVNPQ